MNTASILAFWLAALQLAQRCSNLRSEQRVFSHRLLPEDADTVIDRGTIPAVFDRLEALPPRCGATSLARAVELCATKYQTSHNVQEVSSALALHLENEGQRAEASGALVRYLAWAIPSIGFIGTVMGLSRALGGFRATVSVEPEASSRTADIMAVVPQHLMLAFNTTFVALVLSVVLMLLVHHVGGREDGLLERTSRYCLRNFIVRAWYPPESDSLGGRRAS